MPRKTSPYFILSTTIKKADISKPAAQTPLLSQRFLHEKPQFQRLPGREGDVDNERRYKDFYRAPHKLTYEQFASHPDAQWHGSPWGTIGQGENPLVHLGTWEAAHEALAARVAGQHSKDPIPEVTPGPRTESWYQHKKGYLVQPAPGEEPDPTWKKKEVSHGVEAGLRPSLVPTRIVGPMNAEVRRDIVGEGGRSVPAESLLRGQLKRGIKPKQGYYYKNEGEGAIVGPDGKITYSTSAVVPHHSWLKTHEDFVREAIERGDDVPQEVLADYPHLAGGLKKADITGPLDEEGRMGLGQVSLETVPGSHTEHEGLQGLPEEGKAALHDQLHRVLFPGGRDRLAQLLGLGTEGQVQAPGAWGGSVVPGTQVVLRMPTPRHIVAGETFNQVKAYANLLGYLLHQEAVGYHRPTYLDHTDPANLDKAEGAEIQIGRPLDQGEVRRIYEAATHLAQGMGDPDAEMTPLSTPNGVRFINWTNLPNRAFHEVVKAAAAEALGSNVTAKKKAFAAESGLFANDWKEQPSGENYRRGFSETGRQEHLWGRVLSELGPQVEAVYRRFGAGGGIAAGQGGPGVSQGGDDRPVADPGAEGPLPGTGPTRQPAALLLYGRGKGRTLLQPDRLTPNGGLPVLGGHIATARPTRAEQSGSHVLYPVRADLALYNVDHDPQGLSARVTHEGGSYADLERAIAAAGWDGYHNPPRSGQTVHLFRPIALDGERGTPVTPDGRPLESVSAPEMAAGGQEPNFSYKAVPTFVLMNQTQKAAFVLRKSVGPSQFCPHQPDCDTLLSIRHEGWYKCGNCGKLLHARDTDSDYEDWHTSRDSETTRKRQGEPPKDVPTAEVIKRPVRKSAFVLKGAPGETPDAPAVIHEDPQLGERLLTVLRQKHGVGRITPEKDTVAAHWIYPDGKTSANFTDGHEASAEALLREHLTPQQWDAYKSGGNGWPLGNFLKQTGVIRYASDLYNHRVHMGRMPTDAQRQVLGRIGQAADRDDKGFFWNTETPGNETSGNGWRNMLHDLAIRNVVKSFVLKAMAQEAGATPGPLYHSALRNVLDQSLPNKPVAKQFVEGLIKQHRIAQDEQNESRIHDFLKYAPEKVHRDQVLSHLDTYLPNLQEKAYGNQAPRNQPATHPLSWTPRQQGELLSDLHDGKYWQVKPEGDRHHLWQSHNGRYVDFGAFDTPEAAQTAAQQAHETQAAKPLPSTKTQYKKWSAPGLSKYHEIVATLPGRTPTLPLGYRIQDNGEAAGRGRYALTDSENNPLLTGATEQEIKSRAIPYRAPYQSGHWEGVTNPIFHLRAGETKTTDGTKAYHLDELQSDLHQKGRTAGYQPDMTARNLRQAQINQRMRQIEAEDGRQQFGAPLHNPEWKALREEQLGLAEKEGHGQSREAHEAFSSRLRELGAGRHDRMAPYDVENFLVSALATPEGIAGLRHTYTPEEIGEMTDLRDKHLSALRKYNQAQARVPDLPLKNSWREVAFHRALREAAERGLSRVTWTPGQQQVDRYNLAQHLHSVAYHPASRQLNLYPAANPAGVMKRSNETPEGLQELLGKETADRLLQQPQNEAGYHELAMGGHSTEGRFHKFLYDQFLPQLARQLVKKHGGETGQTDRVVTKGKSETGQELENRKHEHADRVWRAVAPHDSGGSFGETLDMMRHYKAFRLAHGLAAKYNEGERPGDAQTYLNYARSKYPDAHPEGWDKKRIGRTNTEPAHYLDISPALREKLLKEGVPLYGEGGGIKKGITEEDEPEDTMGDRLFLKALEEAQGGGGGSDLGFAPERAVNPEWIEPMTRLWKQVNSTKANTPTGPKFGAHLAAAGIGDEQLHNDDTEQRRYLRFDEFTPAPEPARHEFTYEAHDDLLKSIRQADPAFLERHPQYATLPQTFNTDEGLLHIAGLGTEAQNWYNDWHKVFLGLQTHSEEDRKRFVRFFGAAGNQLAVEQNFGVAARLLSRYSHNLAHTEDEYDALRKNGVLKNLGKNPPPGDLLEKCGNLTEFDTRKLADYLRSFMGFDTPGAVDKWMLRLVHGQTQPEAPSPIMYDYIGGRIRHLAGQMGVRPSEAQAMLWVGYKNLIASHLRGMLQTMKDEGSPALTPEAESGVQRTIQSQEAEGTAPGLLSMFQMNNPDGSLRHLPRFRTHEIIGQHQEDILGLIQKAGLSLEYHDHVPVKRGVEQVKQILEQNPEWGQEFSWAADAKGNPKTDKEGNPLLYGHRGRLIEGLQRFAGDRVVHASPKNGKRNKEAPVPENADIHIGSVHGEGNAVIPLSEDQEALLQKTLREKPQLQQGLAELFAIKKRANEIGPNYAKNEKLLAEGKKPKHEADRFASYADDIGYVLALLSHQAHVIQPFEGKARLYADTDRYHTARSENSVKALSGDNGYAAPEGAGTRFCLLYPADLAGTGAEGVCDPRHRRDRRQPRQPGGGSGIHFALIAKAMVWDKNGQWYGKPGGDKATQGVAFDPRTKLPANVTTYQSQANPSKQAAPVFHVPQPAQEVAKSYRKAGLNLGGHVTYSKAPTFHPNALLPNAQQTGRLPSAIPNTYQGAYNHSVVGDLPTFTKWLDSVGGMWNPSGDPSNPLSRHATVKMGDQTHHFRLLGASQGINAVPGAVQPGVAPAETPAEPQTPEKVKELEEITAAHRSHTARATPIKIDDPSKPESFVAVPEGYRPTTGTSMPYFHDARSAYKEAEKHHDDYRIIETPHPEDPGSGHPAYHVYTPQGESRKMAKDKERADQKAKVEAGERQQTNRTAAEASDTNPAAQAPTGVEDPFAAAESGQLKPNHAGTTSILDEPELVGMAQGKPKGVLSQEEIQKLMESLSEPQSPGQVGVGARAGASPELAAAQRAIPPRKTFALRQGRLGQDLNKDESLEPQDQQDLAEYLRQRGKS